LVEHRRATASLASKVELRLQSPAGNCVLAL
jgi:hypothetical protein